MELWASGFNAWGQLDTAPRDLKEFKCMLRDEYIEILRSTLSATLVKTSTGLHIAGHSDHLVEHCKAKQSNLPNLTVAGNDKVASQVSSSYNTESPSAKETRNGSPAEVKTSLKQYKSFASYLDDDGEQLQLDGETKMITANQCTFTALTVSGEVWTWGDGRYEYCFGREISASKPADTPCIIENLSDLPTGPIRKISSGGYVSAALTEGNDLYIWGGRPGQSKLLVDLNGVPTPVDLDGEDVLDVAVGMSHILALTTTRKLFVVGNGCNGQLGLHVKMVVDWKEIHLSLKYGQQIASVHAGYKNSMVVVENVT